MRAALTLGLAALAVAAAPAGAAFTGVALRAGGGAQAAGVFAPVAAAAPAVAGPAEQGRTLTATTGTWERQPERLDLRWLRCDGAGCAAIAGATDDAYVPAPDDVGRRLRVEVTATNAGGSAIARSAATEPVALGRPVSTAPPGVSGTAVRGERLTATAGSWTGADALAYEWRRCPATGEGACAAIGGATADSYTLTSADVGGRVRVAVRATNAGGSTTAVSAPTAVVAERTPERLYLEAVRRDAPAALYDFNEGDARDSSGHGRGAVPMNAEFGQPGALSGGTSARLNGTNAYLRLPWSPTCAVSGVTYEAWVWWDTGRGYERIFDFGDAGGANSLGLTPHFGVTGLMYGIAWVGGQSYDLRDAPALERWTWKHVALTFAADRRMTIYVDGVARATGLAPWRPDEVGCRPNNWIGRSMFAADPYFGGLQDDVAIYDRALSAAQIKAHLDARAS